MAKDYKQYNYPNIPYAGETIAIAGCGPTACSDILEIDPTITAEWLDSNGWTFPGQGTIYEGIAACLTHFGADGVMLASGLDGQLESPYFDQWMIEIQSGKEGILLMHNVYSSYWTSGGHYIAVVGYNDGQYLVYDPASDARTGWHPWSDFEGDIAAVYTSSRRWKPEEDKYMFEFERIQYRDKGKTVKIWQAILRGRGYIDRQKKGKDKSIDVDGEWGDSSQRAWVYFQEKNGFEPVDFCDEVRWKKLLWR